MTGSAILLLIALGLDRWLGEPQRWHPLVAFGRAVDAVEGRLRGDDVDLNGQQDPDRVRLLGVVGVLVLVLPLTGLIWLLTQIPVIGLIISVLLAYLSIGANSLIHHSQQVLYALNEGNLALARERVGYMVSRNTADMDETQVSKATIESVLENGNDAIFGAFFWFLVAGAPGVVLYRAVNTLDAMWGYRNERYQYFGWAAARLDDVLNFIPARLCALVYGLVGDSRRALQAWQEQGSRWESPNAGPVMATGAGALGLRLGGPAVYHGELKHRPILGLEDDPAPLPQDIERANTLIERCVWFWLAAGLLLFWVMD